MIPRSPIMARPWKAAEASRLDTHGRIRLIFIRAGAASLTSEHGRYEATSGDIVFIGSNVACSAEPAEPIDAIDLWLDSEYVVDQVYWRNVAGLTDRTGFPEPLAAPHLMTVQVLHPTRQHFCDLTPLLNELVALTAGGLDAHRFYRVQSLLFSILQVVVPYVPASSSDYGRPTGSRSGAPHEHTLGPMREEAGRAANLLEADLTRRWTLAELGREVHLSRSRLWASFVDAYGQTPLAYLTTRRIEAMARLLRETPLSVEAIARRLGWDSRSHATQVFRRYVGASPSEYRRETRSRPGPM